MSGFAFHHDICKAPSNFFQGIPPLEQWRLHQGTLLHGHVPGDCLPAPEKVRRSEGFPWNEGLLHDGKNGARASCHYMGAEKLRQGRVGTLTKATLQQ